MPATIKQHKTFDLRSQARAERTDDSREGLGELSSREPTEAGGPANTGPSSFLAEGVTQSRGGAVAGGVAGLLNLTDRKKSAAICGAGCGL
ncbi:hypothetical protein ES703_106835 [subsurface metagenome]